MERREGLHWGLDGRVRLAENLHPAELDIMAEALDTPEGIERLRQELEWAAQTRPRAEQARAKVREAAQGKTLHELEEEARRIQGLTRPGKVEVYAADMERGRIIRLLRATKTPRYDQDQDPQR